MEQDVLKKVQPILLDMLKEIRKCVQVPFIIKGVMSTADAEDACAAGADALIRFGKMDIEDVIGVTADEYSDAVYLQDADVSAGREVIVMRGVDANAAQQIAQRLENYLAQRRKETQNYFPEAYKLLSETSVQRKNNTVALVVHEKATDITKLLLAGE